MVVEGGLGKELLLAELAVERWLLGLGLLSGLNNRDDTLLVDVLCDGRHVLQVTVDVEPVPVALKMSLVSVGVTKDDATSDASQSR